MQHPVTHTAPVISMKDGGTLLRLESCNSEAVCNETDLGDSLLSAPARCDGRRFPLPLPRMEDAGATGVQRQKIGTNMSGDHTQKTAC